jgi:hypothetical protein
MAVQSVTPARNPEIRQDGADFYFVDPLETLRCRQLSNDDDLLSQDELQAVRERFYETESEFESIGQSLSGIADVMCPHKDLQGVSGTNMSSLLELLADRVAISNKRMSDIHTLMCEHFERVAMKKVPARANAKAA